MNINKIMRRNSITEPNTRKELDMNIQMMEARVDAILKYIQENPTSNPNAYEMNDVMFDVADIGYLGRSFEENPYDFLQDEKYNKLMEKFHQMMNYRLNQFISEEQGLQTTNLYNYFQESLRSMSTLNRLYMNGNSKKDLFNSICGVDLYVHQRIWDLSKAKNLDEPIYTNNIENTRIILGQEEYNEELKNMGISPYKTRDDIINTLYDEIEKNYNKSINDRLKEEKTEEKNR